MQRVAGADLGVLVGHLEGRHQVDPGTRLRIDPGPDRAVGEDDRGRVVLEHGGDGPDRGLVAGHDGDQPGDAVRRQVDVGDVVDELATDQGEPHLRRAVELAVRDAEGERGRYQPDRQVVARRCGGTGRPGRPAPSAGRPDSTGCLRGCRSPPTPGRGSSRTSSPRKAAVPTLCTSRPGLRDTNVTGSDSLRTDSKQRSGALQRRTAPRPQTGAEPGTGVGIGRRPPPRWSGWSAGGSAASTSSPVRGSP